MTARYANRYATLGNDCSLSTARYPDKHEIDGVRKEKERLTAASISVYQVVAHMEALANDKSLNHTANASMEDY